MCGTTRAEQGGGRTRGASESQPSWPETTSGQAWQAISKRAKITQVPRERSATRGRAYSEGGQHSVPSIKTPAVTAWQGLPPTENLSNTQVVDVHKLSKCALQK